MLQNKKTMGHKDDGNCGWCTWDNICRIGKETVRLENKGTSRHHPYDYIINIGQNTEMSPGDSRRLAATQTPGENYQQTLG